jgi:hypothetical protein
MTMNGENYRDDSWLLIGLAKSIYIGKKRKRRTKKGKKSERK